MYNEILSMNVKKRPCLACNTVSIVITGGRSVVLIIRILWICINNKGCTVVLFTFMDLYN